MAFRTQTGIYFQKLVYQHIESYLKAMNDYISHFNQNKETESFFENTYGFKAKKIKLVDFTDTVIARFVDKHSFLNISKLNENSPEFKNKIVYIDEIVEMILNENYHNMPMTALLYSERSQRNLYINTQLLKDFEILSEFTFNESIGGKAKLLNELFKEFFIEYAYARPIDFINKDYITSMTGSDITNNEPYNFKDSISFESLDTVAFSDYFELHNKYKDILKEL